MTGTYERQMEKKYDLNNTRNFISEHFSSEISSEKVKETSKPNNIVYLVSNIIQDMGYYLVPLQYRKQYPLDLLSFRLLEINEKVSVILLIPMIIDTNHLNIIVSEQSITYDTKDHTNNKPYVQQLVRVAEALFEELVREHHFFQILHNSLDTPITIEKTIERKPLYFHSDNIEYKLRIDPIIVKKKPPLFSEKTLSFAYQRHSNLHIIGLNQISNLLGFLEQKYVTLESLEKRSNTIHYYEFLKERYSRYFQRMQIPFIGYLILFGIILLSNLPSLTNIMISLGYAAMGLYLFSSGFLYYLIFREKIKITQEFLTPFHKKILNVSDEELFLISEDINPEYLEQLGYECFGKEHSYKTLYELEQKKIEKEIDNKPITIEKKVDELYEPKESTKALHKGIIEKYSSFLDD
ncbi:MAG: hypothetical protein ACFFC1_06900 [Promethearchaeota archaeon]